MNGDGKGDVAVGASNDSTAQGRAYVFSGADGSVLLSLISPDPIANACFGNALAMGDVDDDGKADIAVGAYRESVGGNTDQGRAYVFSGADGSHLFTLDVPNPQGSDLFGSSVAVGDADGDGKGDIAVGAPGADADGHVNRGDAYAFSGASGSLLFSLEPTVSEDYLYFGQAVATGDVNGDGRADIAVGQYREGQVYVYSGTDGSLFATLNTPNPEGKASFGSALAVGETNGDGKVDVAAGAYMEDVGGNADQGRAYVFATDPGAPTPTPTPVAPAEPVGGIAVLPDVAEDGSSSFDWVTLGVLAAAALVALTAGTWYARRQWLR